MPRNRSYTEEYRRRIERGLAKGLTRSEARGHPKAEKPSRADKPRSDARLETAVRAMNMGAPLSWAAKSAQVSPERLRRFIKGSGIANRQGRRWVMKDKRPRQVLVITGSDSKTIVVSGFAQASKAAKFDSAVRYAFDTGDFDQVFAFKGQGVRDHKGKLHLFETDPNELFRYAAKDEPLFHEIYQIVAN